MDEKSQNCIVKDSKENCSEKPSQPGPQRRLRLNRRGFYLSNVQNNEKLTEVKSLGKINLQSKGTNSTSSNSELQSSEKAPVVSDKKKIILSSAKNGFKSKAESDMSKDDSMNVHNHADNSCDTSDSKSGALRSVNVGKKNFTVNLENSNSEEDPPKKKHKPITWP